MSSRCGLDDSVTIVEGVLELDPPTPPGRRVFVMQRQDVGPIGFDKQVETAQGSAGISQFDGFSPYSRSDRIIRVGQACALHGCKNDLDLVAILEQIGQVGNPDLEPAVRIQRKAGRPGGVRLAGKGGEVGLRQIQGNGVDIDQGLGGAQRVARARARDFVVHRNRRPVTDLVDVLP
ncbi:hypothetical protein D3C73_589480 [compost metagenome]